jgi:hypothetical protein
MKLGPTTLSEVALVVIAIVAVLALLNGWG